MQWYIIFINQYTFNLKNLLLLLLTTRHLVVVFGEIIDLLHKSNLFNLE